MEKTKRKYNVPDIMHFHDFIEQCSSSESKNTQSSYARDLREFFHFCGVGPLEVKTIHVVKFVAMMRRRGMSSRTVGRRISALKSYLNFLVYLGRLDKNPIASGLRLPKVVREKRVPLSNDEVKAMIDFIQKNDTPGKEGRVSQRNLAIFFLMLYNGMRRNEICRLNVGDVYLDGDRIVIRIRGKGKKVRIRPLHSKCFEAIRNYLAASGRLKADERDPLFVVHKENGYKRITDGCIYHVIAYAGERAGIKRRIHPHLLRAKFASMALEAGVPITSVAEDLGHSSIETTSIYDHSSSLYERSSVLHIEEIK